MKIEQAIKTALEYETRIRDLYVEAMDETKNPAGKRVFKLLADEEQNHVLYLELKLHQWLLFNKLTFDDLDTAIPASEEIQKELGNLQKELIKDESEKELSALQKAAKLECETSDFYKKLVAQLPKPGSEFFKQFVIIEDGHLALVEAEIDSIKGTGFWFDMPEFDVANR